MKKSADDFETLLARRLSRRDVIGGALGAVVATACSAAPKAMARSKEPASQFGRSDRIELAPGLRHDVVIRWGDALKDGTPDLTSDDIRSGALLKEGAAKLAELRFGINCDGAHFFSLDEKAERGVLCVNNEFPSETLMFPGWPKSGLESGRNDFITAHPEAARVAMRSVGVSTVEIERTADGWRPRKSSQYSTRYHANTLIQMSGPVAGSDWLVKAGRQHNYALGTMGNCGAGRTPWGTYLSAEENVQEFFGGYRQLAQSGSDPKAMKAHARFRLWPRSSRGAWEVVDERFDVVRHPSEPFGFGWIVEIDPMNPGSAVKRTALGRCMHESATCALTRHQRPVVYSGDDDYFEYLYKFIGSRSFDPARPENNRDLLDHGVLHVARFNDDGTGEWLPLSWSESGALSPGNGFRDQADVLMMTRHAADLLKATPLDRPEDIEVNERTGQVYLACTRNEYRQRKGRRGTDASSPRPGNPWGHILELTEHDEDVGAKKFRWEVFILAGDVTSGRLLKSLTGDTLEASDLYFAGNDNPTELVGFGSPDNLALDRLGNLWIVTDGKQPGGVNNGCFVATTSGSQRGRVQQVMSGPRGSEICGCTFAGNDETLFLTIQHPGEGGRVGSPGSHWPDGGDAEPRSAVIAVESGDRRPIQVLS